MDIQWMVHWWVGMPYLAGVAYIFLNDVNSKFKVFV